jgi:hypothetical protein
VAREVVREMRELIDQRTAGIQYQAPTVAHEIVEHLRENDPELLIKWLYAQAERFVLQSINDRDRSVRATARTAAPRRDFAEAIEAHERGDSTVLSGWLSVPFVLEDGTRKRLADMEREDLTSVSNSYAERARQNQMQATFLRALADKVGAGTVKDFFTDEDLSRMWRSLSRP